MPTIEINKKDLDKLVGKKVQEEDFQYVGGEIESKEGDTIQLEIKCRSRPDLWSVEGISRELKGALGIETGLKKVKIKDSDFEVNVSKKLKNKRPFIACAVIKGANLSGKIVEQLMQQQKKIDRTYGRNRSKTSIGLYNLNLIKFPLEYSTTKPNKNAFVPLEFSKKLTPKQIVRKHPKGREYGHLLEGMKEYPIYKDKRGKILSMPPIINSDDLGKISGNTKEVLIEVTGTDYETVQNVLRIMSLSLVERGGKIHSVKIKYPYRKDDVTPSFSTEKMKISKNKVNSLLGTDFSSKKVKKLLKRARYRVKGKTVEIPSYRTDIMSNVDIIEDIAIMCGYNNFANKDLKLPTEGKLNRITEFSDKIREIMIGFGAQEVMNFSLTSEKILKSKMNLKAEPVKISNPISSTYEALRNSLLPCLLNFLSKNTTKKFPQKIFEVGEVFKGKQSTKKLAFCLSSTDADFTHAKQIIESLLRNLGMNCRVKEAEHGSFTKGRVGKVYAGRRRVGLVGEISKKVRDNFGLEKKTVGFELSLEDLLKKL